MLSVCDQVKFLFGKFPCLCSAFHRPVSNNQIAKGWSQLLTELCAGGQVQAGLGGTSVWTAPACGIEGATDLLDVRMPSPNVPGNTEAERFDHVVHKPFAVSKEVRCAVKQSCWH